MEPMLQFAHPKSHFLVSFLEDSTPSTGIGTGNLDKCLCEPLISFDPLAGPRVVSLIYRCSDSVTNWIVIFQSRFVLGVLMS